MFIPDPRFEFFSIPDPDQHLRNYDVSNLTPIKLFLCSLKYDQGLFIPDPDPDPDFYPSRIPDPGVKKAPDPGSGSATLDGT